MEWWGSSYQFASRLWTPADDMPDLWFKASDINQANTSSWVESQGRLTVTRAGVVPSFVAFGNETAVNFNDATSYTGTYSVANLTGLTFIAIGAVPAITTAFDCLMAWQTQGNFSTDALLAIQPTNQYIAQVNASGDGTLIYQTPLSSLNGLMMAVYDGTQGTNADRLRMFYNTVISTGQSTNTVPTSIPANMPTTLRFGEYENILSNFRAAHYLVYRRAISVDLRQRIEGWSSWTSGVWSLPAGHPYASAPPTI